MSYSTWTPHAVLSNARPWRGSIWRVVEAQHIAATMKLVDSRDEQDVLETLLESSKPALSEQTIGLDYLLATPFRYPPRAHGSRFRTATDPGVFYGAQEIRTACAELGYWRWQFLLSAIGLDEIEPVAHTAFQAKIAAAVVDLRKPPFSQTAHLWQHPSDYSATQAFAKIAREAKLGGIHYTSVRDPKHAGCLAVLTPAAFAIAKPNPISQTWWLSVQKTGVIWRRDKDSMGFSFSED